MKLKAKREGKDESKSDMVKEKKVKDQSESRLNDCKKMIHT
jgi:hypothetical protein